ncbi:DUF3048 domain-containing protein [Streptomyces aureocirculatus]|uniref:DUF3048 domain-containing protein n=1 Tax=Streptomyces aureocirculatus TaxID=67275 RepID=UPI0004C83CEB|nr:DUF3048 domain-containing protein [Streptomyces aureocirculatus]
MTSRRRQWRAAMAVALLAALAPACTLEERPGAGRDEKRPVRGGAEGRVLAVKIDNVRPARPQTGLDAADVVYAEQVEAGLSRLMAVYATRLPPVVGPVRSARETDLELLRQFDRPALAFSGAQNKLLPLIGRAPLRALPAEGPAEKAYHRGDDRPAPHNLYLRPAALGVRPEPSGLKSTGFTFGPRPSGGTPLTRHTVTFPSARFTFTWVEYEGRWHISMDDDTARTPEGKALSAATVVVQRVDVRDSRYHDSSGNSSPLTRSVGSGTAKVLRDGRSYEARWERRTAEGGTEFSTPDGKPLAFARGPVWVVFTKA